MRQKIMMGCVLILGVMTLSTAHAKRVALLIGNATYQYENRLSNPINDAVLLQNVLKNDLKFDEVKLVKDADIRTLNREVEAFNQTAQNADVAVIYFSGHGQQGENRQNYLLATDAKIEQAADLRLSAVSSDDLVSATEGAKARVVILDACRDRPNSGFKSATKGLSRAPISGQGLLVAYATEAGKVAQDGSTGNSPYAKALAQAIRKNDKSIFAIFDEVADEVKVMTKGQQSPTREGNLRIDVYFVNPTITVNQNSKTTDKPDAELMFWDSIKNETEARGYVAYLEQYPQGRFKALAKTRIQKYSPVYASLMLDDDKKPILTLPVQNTVTHLNDSELMQQGMWRDPKTNLLWMRCSLGQTWDGATCMGEASKHTWDNAFKTIEEMNREGFGGYKDWRLPDIEELNSIRYCSDGYESMPNIPTTTKTGRAKSIYIKCGSGSQRPTIDTKIFPNTKVGWEDYWSSSSDCDGSKHLAWSVSLFFGSSSCGASFKTNNNLVRAVRNGQ